MKRKQVTCRCNRLAFPHRKQEQCRDFKPRAPEHFSDGPGQMYWQDIRERTAALRSEA
jgi:hypothetical protein